MTFGINCIINRLHYSLIVFDCVEVQANGYVVDFGLIVMGSSGGNIYGNVIQIVDSGIVGWH